MILAQSWPKVAKSSWRSPFNSHLTATNECTNLGRNAKKVRLKHLTKAPMENFEEKIILLTAPYERTNVRINVEKVRLTRNERTDVQRKGMKLTAPYEYTIIRRRHIKIEKTNTSGTY